MSFRVRKSGSTEGRAASLKLTAPAIHVPASGGRVRIGMRRGEFYLGRAHLANRVRAIGFLHKPVGKMSKRFFQNEEVSHALFTVRFAMP
jgi:hypothetical protein